MKQETKLRLIIFASIGSLLAMTFLATVYVEHPMKLELHRRRRLTGDTPTQAPTEPNLTGLHEWLIRLQATTTTNMEDNTNAVNSAWIVSAACMCFLLQAGFGFLEAGAIRPKNIKNIMVKNYLDAAIGGFAYFTIGYAFSYGSPGDGTGNKFSGGEISRYFFMLDVPKAEYYGWFFQWVFAAATATIVSGAVAERIQQKAYLVYSFCLTGMIYPWAAHWAWSVDGFLARMLVIDYAGGGAVHMLAGAAAFAGAYLLGPRIGRFMADGTPQNINGHSAPFMALGVFILWFGFIPFVSGCGLSIAGIQYWMTPRLAILTALAGCSGGCTGLLTGYYASGYKVISLEYVMNGVLCGMVGICSCCAMVEIWHAVFFIAPISMVFFLGLQKVLLRFQVDDPLGASSLHWGPGLIGMLSVGIFGTKEYTDVIYGADTNGGCPDPFDRLQKPCADFYGIFYGGNGKQLGYQIAGSIIYTIYSLGICFLMFGACKALGWLRVSKEDELRGMDLSKHGGYGYHYMRENGYNEEKPSADSPDQAGQSLEMTIEKS